MSLLMSQEWPTKDDEGHVKESKRIQIDIKVRNIWLVIYMQINLNTPHQSFPLLSPIFQHTPMLSPLPEDTLRKYSYNYEEFASFRLEPCQDQNYLLFEIQELPQEHLHTETNLQDEKGLSLKKELPNQKIVQLPLARPLLTDSEIKVQMQVQNDVHSDSQKEQLSSPFQTDRIYSRLEKLIHLLILNLNKDQSQIKKQVLKDFQNQNTFSDIISILIKKFRKSKKTKEEMVKYCMRKAFKFIADKMKKNRTHNRDIDSCMRIYFSKNQSNQNFSIPFKKNSIEKTMNGTFLKRIFTAQNFLDDYKDFLNEFEELIEDDNYRKIKYLAEMIENYVKTGQEKKIQTIKRLPWTQQMLQQTLHLSKTLIEYAEKDSPVSIFKRKGE